MVNCDFPEQELIRVYLDHLLSSLGEAMVIDEVSKMMSGTQAAEKMDVLGKLAASAALNVKAESRKEDPAWFEGTEANFSNFAMIQLLRSKWPRNLNYDSSTSIVNFKNQPQTLMLLRTKTTTESKSWQSKT